MLTAAAGNPASLMVSACAVGRRPCSIAVRHSCTFLLEPQQAQSLQIKLTALAVPWSRYLFLDVGNALLESGFWKRLPDYLPRMVAIVAASFILFRKPISPPNTFLARQRKRTWIDRRDRPDFEKLTKTR